MNSDSTRGRFAVITEHGSIIHKGFYLSIIGKVFNKEQAEINRRFELIRGLTCLLRQALKGDYFTIPNNLSHDNLSWQ